MQFPFRQPRMPRPDEVLPGRPDPILAEPGLHHVNHRPIAGPYPEGTEIADFALGCFWGPEQMFWQLEGVWVTAVGYAGGETPNPTYRESVTGLTGHAETVRVVFDPAVVTYAELLRRFWEYHDPTQGFRQGNDVGTEYRSAIFTHSPEQDAVARASRDMFQAELDKAGYGRITTEVAPAGPFYFAEDYHQQYLAKNPGGYCPNHSTGVRLPDVAVTPLQYAE